MLTLPAAPLLTAAPYSPPDISAAELRGYRRWPRANAKPVRMDPFTAALCRQPSLPSDVKPQNPHAERYLQVFVSPEGAQAFLRGQAVPVGTRVVKEKRRAAWGQVELSTVMVKRRRGFNPACGDWEFAVLDGSGQRVTASGALKSCMECHRSQAQTDFLYRYYLGMRTGLGRMPDRRNHTE
jgi:hypothetical protein